ncbi:MAG: phage tail protein [Saprospiraceae bacterium]
MAQEKHKFPYAGFNFEITIDGFNDEESLFQEVSGISGELQFETVNPGGENNTTLKLPTRSKFSNLVLKKGMTDAGSKLISWCSDCILDLSNLDKFENKKKNVTLNLLNEKRKSVCTWVFIDCYPVKWEISGINAVKSEIALETIELAYKYFKITN